MIALPSPSAVPLPQLLAAAACQPHAEALRHKQRGAWVAWSWAELLARVEQLATALQARQPAARLMAVSGAYAPDLLLFTLAAARLGAAVVPLPTGLSQPALAEWLAAARPELAFVGLREQVALWRGAARRAGYAPTIIADAALPWGRPAGTDIISAAALLGPAPEARPARQGGDAVWIEEATDWADGLSYILHLAVQPGRVLAFPESRAAAGRDRQELQPAAFALSAAHHAQLQHDLAARLPAGRGATVWVARAALQAARAGRARAHHRWLLAHMRRPLGLGRLRELTVVAATGEAVPGAADDLFAALGIRAGHALPPQPPAAANRPEFAFA